MSYYLFLVETKKEYTIHLTNVLAPLMYEGINSIYEDAKNNSSDGEELKLFQSLLRKIPSWNEYLIERETNRIVKLSSKGDIIEDLIKAVIKSNIMILTNTSPEKKDNIRVKHDITTIKFIHNSYIEVARNIFQNPFLFYHKYNSFELKKNQREANEIIKKSIEQAIRKLLPMNMILQNYLGATFENQSDDFQNPIPNSDYNNLKNILNKDPYNNEKYELVKSTDRIKSNNIVNVKLEAPKIKQQPIILTENFKKLKELSNLEHLTADEKAEQIIINKTEEIIKQSEKIQSEKNQSEKNQSEKNQSEKNQSEKKELEQKKSEKKNILEAIRYSDNTMKESLQNNVISNKQIFKDNKIKKKIDIDSEDNSVSYFRQMSDKNEVAEVYDNDKIKDKTFLNVNHLLNVNSSENFKSIINDLSSDKNIGNNNNKKKYFNKNLIV